MSTSTLQLEPELLCSSQPRNLEIRGTWNGEVNGLAKLRISLEVQGIPNTQIQVLDTRPASVLLGAASVQFQSEEWGQNSQPSGCSPRSPLFEFFEPIYADSEAIPMNSKGFVDTVNEYPSGEAHGEMSPSNLVLLPGHEDKDLMEVSLSEEHSRGLRPNFAKRDDQIKMINSGKRSATDACLTDAGSDAEDDQLDRKHLLKDSTHNPNTPEYHLDVQEKLVPLERDDTAELMSQTRPHLFPENPSMPTSRLETVVGMQRPSDSEKDLTNAHCPQDLDDSSGSVTADTGSLRDEETSRVTLATRKPSRFHEIDFTGPDTVLELTKLITSSLGQEGMSNSRSMSPSSDTGPAGTLETDVDHDLSTESTSLLDIEQAVDLEPDNFEPDPLETHEHNSDDTGGHEPCKISANEPELNILDGILVIQNPANVCAGIYKVIVTVSILLLGGPGDWYDLVIPGLPNMRTGESGLILFLTPENYGVEFRTTNLQRYKMVEDCLFAEFVDKRDLVIPMRSFDQRNYGIIRDFALDQEIEAIPLLSSVSEETKHTPSGLSVRYHAMCSLRLQQRCFWAEKCCFFLDLDGGPEGFFQCRLRPPDTGLQIIHVPANDSSCIGISRLQIICSPRDLEMFCITWLVHIPFTAMNWLPRIYPVSTFNARERSRSQLRAAFTRLHANMATKEENYQCIMLVLQREGGVDTRNVEAWVDCGASEGPKQWFYSQYTISSINIMRKVLKVAWTSATGTFPTWIAFRKELLVLILVVTVTVCGTLGCLILSHTYSRVFYRPGGPSIQTNPRSLGKSQMDGRILGGGEPDFECSFAEHLFKQTPDSIGSAWLSNDGNASNHGALNSSETIDVGGNDKELKKEQVSAEEQSTRTIDAPGAELASMSGKDLSLRDKIDYLLGWKGPTDRTT
ncbi:hypothetical protein BDV28DRAFT_161321 [Aspergillus coremiiformis]|uniref:Uncharacterized protein n=1 Tax=Aspergillus coremiiformis TaxID=138285 RepID=A0A5N6YSJ4_9EURO|nr:hypothetical protein BDV28DRAFT_161321 [Aspergillus coremiiformis]